MRRFFIFFVLILLHHVCLANTIIGEDREYIVQKGDSLVLIGAKFGVDWRIIAGENKIDIKKILKVGQRLRVNTRKIVPRVMDSGIIINIPDRMLYFFKEGRLVSAFPVGLGMPLWQEMSRWRTPEARFKITGKLINPTWHVPESIQQEMQIKGQEVKTIVLPGHDNPLGRYALRTSIPGVLIHETIWPTSVYQFRSHGCIRVLAEHMEGLFRDIEEGTAGELIYEPVKVAVLEGRVFLEVNKDIYGKVKDMKAKAKNLIDEAGIADKVDWEKVDRVVKNKSGRPEEVGQ